MQIIKFDVDKDKCTYIERLNFDINGYENVVTACFKTYRDEPDVLEAPTFTRYHNRLIQLRTEFDLAKSRLADEIVPEWLKKSGYSYRWVLDYTTSTFTITIDTNDDISHYINAEK